MKEIRTIFRSLSVILLASVLVVSCKKDEDEPIDLLPGTWTVDDTDFDAQVGGTPILQYFTGQGYTQSDAQFLVGLFNTMLEQNFTGTITLKADNTYTANLGGQADSGTWSLSSDNTKLTIDPSTEDAFTMNIDSLTENELRVSWTETGMEDLNDDQVPENITVNVKVRFTK